MKPKQDQKLCTDVSAVLDLLPNQPDARARINYIVHNYTLLGMYFDLAFGATPCIKVLYSHDGDQLLERVRLQ